ncbi:superfamily I DNA/RNA helicase [Spiroplasma corruscae]|uniref:Superfamily I DNA/RNA helicase n=1 Tax=Spiroplasma corruscae TaxID=216934 RepID=A0A222EQ54_9MOLU|nr:AAA domain-containing protein [Spiroplasma corruscae]ASP28668.1 superfamily I DNA/RNA helicase [Spiroplasma corruscae]
MPSIIKNEENKELIFDFSFMQNVKFKDNLLGLDNIVVQLEISGVNTYNEFLNFLKQSLVKKSFICLIDNKTRVISKKDSLKETYDGIIRLELDTHNQSFFKKGTYLGFFVNIDPKDATLTVASIFITRLKPIAQEFETTIDETTIFVLRHKNQVPVDEVLRRNILNSSTLLSIGKLLSTFEEEKYKWLNYLDFCEDLLKLQRKNSLPFLGAVTNNVIKIDKILYTNDLQDFVLNNYKTKSFIFLKQEAVSVLSSLNINFDQTKVVTFDVLSDNINKINKLKKTQDLYVLPLSYNENILNTHNLLENIETLFDFDLINQSDQNRIVPLQLMIGISQEEVSLKNYWKLNKDIVLGGELIFNKYISKYPTEMDDYKVYKMSYELSQEVELDFFNIKNNIDYLNSGYISYLGFGDDVLIERSRQVLKRISDGNTKNPYLINYLFNTKLISLSESSDEEVIDDKDFYFKLNKEQKDAVCKAVNTKDVFILQGPPGTGKTQVICEIIYQLSKEEKKILLSSQNHEAIKNVVDRLPIDPNINRVRLVNQLNTKSSAANNFSPERVVYNYYRSIAKKMFDDINNSNSSLKEFSFIKQKLESLIILEKSFHKDNKEIRELKKELSVINDKIKEINLTTLDYKKLINTLKEDLFTIENLIYSLEEKSFDSVVSFSENLVSFFDKHFKLELKNFILKYTDIDYSLNDNNYYNLLTLINKEVFEKSELFKSIKQSKILIQSYKKTFEVELLKNEESRLNGLFQIVNNDLVFKELITLYDNIIDELKIEKIRLQANMETYKNQEQINKDSELLEIEKNKVLVKINKINDSLNTNTKDLRDLIKFVNKKFNLNLGVTDIDLDLVIKAELDKIEKNLLDSKNRFENNSSLYKSIINYLKENYLIDDNFDKDLPTNKFTSQMYVEGKKYTQTIINSLINIYAMTLTSSNIFRYKKDQTAKKIGLEEINVKTLDVDVVIIDEASKATLLEILMPLVYGKSLILVGDYRQLPPILKLKSSHVDEVNKYFNKDYSYIDLNNLLNESIFKKLISANNNSITTMLRTQYRSHKQIMEVVNKFYENNLNVDEGVSEIKKHDLVIKNAFENSIIDSRSSVYWIDSSYDINNNIFYEQSEEYSTSLFNELEIEITKSLLKKIDKSLEKQNKLKKPSIAVISFYSLQVNKLNRIIKKSLFKNFDLVINTVDDFQGKEADYVIVNLVRNAEKISVTKGREFLKKYERINVAFSRARELLIIVGAERMVKDVMVKIPTIANPDVTNSQEVYTDIINLLDYRNCFFKSKDVIGD